MPGTAANGSGGGNSDLPLAGLRVLNLGWYWVCATMSHLLADMGAEVIKVDSRQRLETLRGIPPFMDGIEDPDRNLWLHNLLRNTQSITVNLETEEGRERLRDLVRTVDGRDGELDAGHRSQAWHRLRLAAPLPARPHHGLALGGGPVGAVPPHQHLRPSDQHAGRIGCGPGLRRRAALELRHVDHRPFRGHHGLLRRPRRPPAPQRDRTGLPRRLLAVGDVDGDVGAALPRLPVERQAPRPRGEPRRPLRPQQRLSLRRRRPMGLDLGLRGAGVAAGCSAPWGGPGGDATPASPTSTAASATRRRSTNASRRGRSAARTTRQQSAYRPRAWPPSPSWVPARPTPIRTGGPAIPGSKSTISSDPNGFTACTGSSAARRDRCAPRRPSSASTTAASSATSWGAEADEFHRLEEERVIY